MPQKTVDLIRGWSIVVGVVSLASLITISSYGIASAAGLISVIAILLGLAVLYAGVKVASMNLQTVNAIFWAKFIWLIVNFLYSVSGRSVSLTRLLLIAVQGVIVWYLMATLKKFSHPAAAEQPPVNK